MNDSERLVLLQKELCEREFDLLDYMESHDTEEMVKHATGAIDDRRPYDMSTRPGAR